MGPPLETAQEAAWLMTYCALPSLYTSCSCAPTITQSVSNTIRRRYLPRRCEGTKAGTNQEQQLGALRPVDSVKLAQPELHNEQQQSISEWLLRCWRHSIGQSAHAAGDGRRRKRHPKRKMHLRIVAAAGEHSNRVGPAAAADRTRDIVCRIEDAALVHRPACAHRVHSPCQR